MNSNSVKEMVDLNKKDNSGYRILLQDNMFKEMLIYDIQMYFIQS